MKHHLRNLLLLPVILFLASCGKDDEAPATASQIISGKQWVTTALTVNPPLVGQGGVSVSDLYAYYAANGLGCLNDNIKFFNADGKYTIEEGENRCENSDYIVEAGSWQLSSDESAVNTSQSGYPFSNISYDIVELNNDVLQLRYIVWYQINEEGDEAPYTFTETHSRVQ